MKEMKLRRRMEREMEKREKSMSGIPSALI
jgi:hypothetical protein